MKQLRKLVGRFYIRLFLLFHEHTHKGKKYAYKKGTGNDLLVFFSGFGEHYEKGLYNYIRSSQSIKTSKLWILDNDGFCQAGTYYLGENFESSNSRDIVKEIIDKYSKNKKIVCCGSSKGGTAALIFGFLCNASKVIAGSPQYYIGDYLEENDFYLGVKKSICSDCNATEKLNAVLKDLIWNRNHQPKICLLYSSKERHYVDQLLPLIEDLKSRGFDLSLKDGEYPNHQDVGRYYPNYLKSNL